MGSSPISFFAAMFVTVLLAHIIVFIVLLFKTDHGKNKTGSFLRRWIHRYDMVNAHSEFLMITGALLVTMLALLVIIGVIFLVGRIFFIL